MTTLLLIGMGAALMYFFDPDSGRRRRVRLRDRYTSAAKNFQGSARTAQDVNSRTSPVTPETPPGE